MTLDSLSEVDVGFETNLNHSGSSHRDHLGAILLFWDMEEAVQLDVA
jgi:hypothetical protein